MASAKAKKASYKLRLGFSGSISDVEEWLERYCTGKYSYQFEDIKETGAVFNKIELLFDFEHDEDRQNFKEAVKIGTF